MVAPVICESGAQLWILAVNSNLNWLYFLLVLTLATVNCIQWGRDAVNQLIHLLAFFTIRNLEHYSLEILSTPIFKWFFAHNIASAKTIVLGKNGIHMHLCKFSQYVLEYKQRFPALVDKNNPFLIDPKI